MIIANKTTRQTTALRTAALLCICIGVCSSHAAEVRENWTKHCASCHGATGKGDTKAGKKADVKDLTDAKYQEGFSDDQMFKQIKEGMKDKNGKEKMKAFSGSLSDEEIKALVAHVRTLKK